MAPAAHRAYQRVGEDSGVLNRVSPIADFLRRQHGLKHGMCQSPPVDARLLACCSHRLAAGRSSRGTELQRQAASSTPQSRNADASTRPGRGRKKRRPPSPKVISMVRTKERGRITCRDAAWRTNTPKNPSPQRSLPAATPREPFRSLVPASGRRRSTALLPADRCHPAVRRAVRVRS